MINHRRITAPIPVILNTIRSETKGRYLKDIVDKGKEVLCTCPFHKNGTESKPACTVVNDPDRDDIEYGTFHCFACKEAGTLSKFIGRCLAEDNFTAVGEQWLLERFGLTYVQEFEYLPEITLENNSLYLNPTILDNYEYNNQNALDYLINKRHIIPEVVEWFKLGFDPKDNCVTFPCWDANNKLVGIFKRSIYGKFFHIPDISPKPIYLLNVIKNYSYQDVIVVESQINALTCWSWGFPAIALFGTGSYEQYQILNHSGIRSYTLAFDGDAAGRRGREKFIKNISKDVLVTYIDLPEGKDVNDLTKEEFMSIERKIP